MTTVDRYFPLRVYLFLVVRVSEDYALTTPIVLKARLANVCAITLTFLATAVLDKRNFHFFTFLSRDIEPFTINHLGKVFTAFHDVFYFVEALQARC